MERRVDDPLIETVRIRMELELQTRMKRWQRLDVRRTQSYCICSSPRNNLIDVIDELGRSLR